MNFGALPERLAHVRAEIARRQGAAGPGAPSGGPGAPGARGAHDDRAVHRGRGAAAAHVPRPPVAARRTEGGWAMAGDALDGDVRRLRYSGRGGGNGDPLGYRPVRAEGDGSGSRGTGGGAGDGGREGGVSESAFHLTPLDVRKQEFRKSLRGYEPTGVEDFRVRVADELERILREESVLEERVAALGEQLRAYRERERAMNEALVAAQQLREATHTAAQREAQVVLREAEAEARRVLDAAAAGEADGERRAAEVQRQYQQYVGGFRALLERQLAELRALDGQHGG